MDFKYLPVAFGLLSVLFALSCLAGNQRAQDGKETEPWPAHIRIINRRDKHVTFLMVASQRSKLEGMRCAADGEFAIVLGERFKDNACSSDLM